MSSNTKSPEIKSAEIHNLTLSITLAEAIAQGKTQIELAEIASFFSSLGSNLSLIIQSRNVAIANAGANLGVIPGIEES